MIQNKTVLVTVCCRGGSKGIPNKGLKQLGGKPLIAWTIDLLPQLKYMDNWVLSSDAVEYFEVIKRLHEPFTSNGYGHQRPKELANDTVSRVEAVKEAVIATEKKFHTHYDIIVDCGVATPFKTAGDVNRCIEAVFKEGYDHIITGFEGNHNPYFDMVEFDFETGGYRLCKTTVPPPTCRQDAAEVFTLNDAVNVWTREALFEGGAETDLIEMDEEHSVHLDTPLDWAFAEFLLEKGYISKEVK